MSFEKKVIIIESSVTYFSWMEIALGYILKAKKIGFSTISGTTGLDCEQSLFFSKISHSSYRF